MRMPGVVVKHFWMSNVWQPPLPHVPAEIPFFLMVKSQTRRLVVKK